MSIWIALLSLMGKFWYYTKVYLCSVEKRGVVSGYFKKIYNNFMFSTSYLDKYVFFLLTKGSQCILSITFQDA